MTLIKKTSIEHLLAPRGVLSLKRRLLTGCEILFTSIVFITNAYPSGRGIHEDDLFYELHPPLLKRDKQIIQEVERQNVANGKEALVE